jgi:hypothetical protein
LAWACAPTHAFVILDTSEPGKAPAADTSARHPAATVPQVPGAGYAKDSAASRAPDRRADTLRNRREPARYRNVLFLSADSKLIYAYIGVLKALEEYGLAPDAVLAESKAVLVGAAWALGYSATAMERELLRRPLEGYLRPFPERQPIEARAFAPAGPDPLQWNIPLGVQSLQSPGSRWKEVTMDEAGEYLHLSWMVAQLTHDAPGGPVEDLAAAPRRLAVQVSDLETDQVAVLTDGGLQNILKGSLLPADVVRRRSRLWPYASGALLSGHAVIADKLPFACDRIIMVQPGRRLRPPALESGPLPWTDSLTLRAKRRAAGEGLSGEAAAPGLAAKALHIELEPEGDFDPAEPDPARWLELGYTSALRSMDVLKSALAGTPTGPAGGAARSGDRLGLNRLSVNPLASGGRQLLLDILRISEDQDDGSGEGPIRALVSSGFYSDLDVEWARGSDQEKALLVFDAREKSKVHFRAGWNAAFTGEEVVDRAPELYGGLAWSEPFYIPFQGEVGALLGGHRPGYEFRFQIAPVYPLRLELGLSRTHWEILYPFDAPKPATDMGALAVRLRRSLSELFLNLYPTANTYLKTSIQKHEMDFPSDLDAGDGNFLSTDFQETAYLGLGRPAKDGFRPQSWRLRYRYMNQVNLAGAVKFPFSSLESRLALSLGDFRLVDQYFWSDQDTRDLTIFDLMQTGRISAFTFQDEYFLSYLRSANFQDARIEYRPTFGKAGLRLTAGAWRNYGSTLFEKQAERHDLFGMASPGRAHWEAQAGYATPLGALRVGMGGLDGETPFYYVRLGASLELGFADWD